jgi:hypothetical protein
MAIAIDNPDLREGQEVIVWQVVPHPTRSAPLAPGEKRITSAIRGKGVIVPGGIDYEHGTITIRTADGETVTASAGDMDFAASS